MRTAKYLLLSALVTVTFVALLEGAGRLFSFPGSYDFIERSLIEQGLHKRKNPGELRIMLYGESTMQGSHLYPHSTIGKWLSLLLRDLLPPEISKRVTVTNLARLGAGSRFVATSFIDTIPYKPDLAIFYTVHNDFIQTQVRSGYAAKPSLFQRIEAAAKELPRQSAFLNAVRGIAIRAKIERNKARDAAAKKRDPWYEDDAAKNIAEGDLLRPSSPLFRKVSEGFEANVEKIVSVSRRNAIPIVILEGVARWKGYEPLRSVHGPSLLGKALVAWTGAYDEAEQAFAAGKYTDALPLYIKCYDLDPVYALTLYRIGECHERLGDAKQANEWYSRANDLDAFPIRAPSSVNRFYESIRARKVPGVIVIPTQEIFELQSGTGIIDEDLIGDQIHPTIKGQALIAYEIVKSMSDNGILAPKEKWQWEKLRSPGQLRKGLHLSNDDEYEICLALAGYVKHHYVKAAEFLEKAVALRPKSVWAKSWLAWTYWKAGEKAKALDLYRQLERQAPELASKHIKKYPDIAEALRS